MNHLETLYFYFCVCYLIDLASDCISAVETLSLFLVVMQLTGRLWGEFAFGAPWCRGVVTDWLRALMALALT